MTFKNPGQITIMILSSLQEFYEALIPNTAILCVDYGAKKLGFAISDHAFTMSLPLNVVVAEKLNSKLRHIMDMAQKYRASGIVIGLPLNMDGTNSEQTKKVIYLQKNYQHFRIFLFFFKMKG